MGYTLANDSACDRKRTAASSAVRPKTHTPGSPLQKPGQRFHNPGIGRWMNRDPIGERGGVLLYGFVDNNPEDFVDIIGTVIICCAPRPYFESLGIPSAWAVETSLFTYEGAQVPAIFSGDAEIVFDMLQSRRRFWVKNLDVQELKAQVKSRREIVVAARAVTFGSSSALLARFNPNYWHAMLTPVTPDMATIGMRDAWVNPSRYSMACNPGSLMAMMKGILETIGNAQFNAAYAAGGGAAQPVLLHQALFTVGLMKRVTVNDEGDWVPGDRGRFINVGQPSSIYGGEYVIYIGQGKWWGHGPGEKTLDEWRELFVETELWFGYGLEIEDWREQPMIGLQ